MLLVTLAWSGGVATAQEPPPDSGGPPLAVPIGSSQPPPPAVPPRASPPPPPSRVMPRGRRPHAPAQAPTQTDAAHAAAIRQYRDQYLSTRQIGTTKVDVDYDYVPYGVY